MATTDARDLMTRPLSELTAIFVFSKPALRWQKTRASKGYHRRIVVFPLADRAWKRRCLEGPKTGRSARPKGHGSLDGAEEVEHKAVAFDTMRHLRGGYWRQVRTQLVVAPVMLLLWIRGVRFLYSVDPYLRPGTKPRWRGYFRAARRGLVPGPLRLVWVVKDYYRPGFHPSQLGGLERAVDYLAVSPAARGSH